MSALLMCFSSYARASPKSLSIEQKERRNEIQLTIKKILSFVQTQTHPDSNTDMHTHLHTHKKYAGTEFLVSKTPTNLRFSLFHRLRSKYCAQPNPYERCLQAPNAPSSKPWMSVLVRMHRCMGVHAFGLHVFMCVNVPLQRCLAWVAVSVRVWIVASFSATHPGFPCPQTLGSH